MKLIALLTFLTAFETFGTVYFWGTGGEWLPLVGAVCGAIALIVFICAEVWGE